MGIETIFGLQILQPQAYCVLLGQIPCYASEFLGKVNAQLGSETFYAVWFHPSAFLGIVNLSILKPEEKQRLDELGFFGSNR